MGVKSMARHLCLYCASLIPFKLLGCVALWGSLVPPYLLKAGEIPLDFCREQLDGLYYFCILALPGVHLIAVDFYNTQHYFNQQLMFSG